LRQSVSPRGGVLNILVPHLKRKDILFNAISEAIALVQSHPFPGRAKHLKNQVAKALVFGKGGSVEHNWDTYIEVARKFEHKALFQDREDLRHSIIVEIAEAKSRNGDKPFTEATMCRIASYVVADYYRGLRLPSGNLPCGRCSKAQRAKCQKDDLYSQCRKGVEVVSLNSHIEDGEGHSIELIDTIADDSAIDLDAWLDARTWLLGCPRRLVRIAHKRVNGIPLEGKDKEYLRRFRKNGQKRLF
jgi:hypothetical protein